MGIDKIIFDEAKDLSFIDERFIYRIEPQVWKVSQLMDGTCWNDKDRM